MKRWATVARISWQDEVHIAAEAAWRAYDRFRPPPSRHALPYSTAETG
jgi:hypothetical protein